MPSEPSTRGFQPALETFLKQLTTVIPREPKLTVGLDIGSTAVKVIALGQRKGSGRRPKVGQNLVALGAEPDEQRAEAVRSAVGALKLPVRSVNLSVSGQAVIMRVVEMPSMKPAELRQALPFEAQRYLPFKIEEVVVDGTALGPTESNPQKMWVLIVACRKEYLERRVAWVKQAGLELAVVDVDALALANACLDAGTNGAPTPERRALINVGARLTNLVVLKGEVPYLVRDIPWGGETIVRHLADALGRPVESILQDLTQNRSSDELQSAMRVTCEGLVAELQLSFDYFENHLGQSPEVLLVSGGVSQAAVFLEALKAQLTQPVHSWSPLEGLSGQFAVAYGLALRTT